MIPLVPAGDTSVIAGCALRLQGTLGAGATPIATSHHPPLKCKCKNSDRMTFVMATGSRLPTNISNLKPAPLRPSIRTLSIQCEGGSRWHVPFGMLAHVMEILRLIVSRQVCCSPDSNSVPDQPASWLQINRSFTPTPSTWATD